MRALRNRLTYANVVSALAVAGLCLALGATPGNSATPTQSNETIKHKGRFVGIGGSRVTFSIVMKDGKPVRMKRLRFADYPVFCSGVRDGWVRGRREVIRMRGRHVRVDHPLKGPPSWSASDFQFFGKVKDDGHKATGKMQWRFVDTSGDRCNTGLHRWKTHG